ncbi:MAG TPA: hypothetical protein VNX15_04220 [Gemmatimonadales bacterium]|nr:hypothetical protein [Gemmatimonadales bacterium]
MTAGRRASVFLLATLITACGEARQPLTPSVTSRVAASRMASRPSGGITCDFTSINKSVTRYFSGTEAKAVKTIVAAMQLAGIATPAAQGFGFDIFVHVANNVKAGNTDVTDGGALTNGVLACMYTNAADLPLAFPEDFSVALDPAQHGAFEIRGGASDSTGPAVNRPLTAPFSGVKPMSGTWATMLAGNPAPSRLLLYGRPGSTTTSYDWKVVPRSATFAGAGAMVGVCVDATSNSTSLLHEENIGLLPFQDASFLDPVSCSPIAAVPSRNLLQKLASAVGSFFVPAPLYGNPGGLAGSTSGIHSEFGPQVVDSALATFIGQPSNVQAGHVMTPPVRVLITASGSGLPVPNTAVTLGAFNNNGTPALLTGTLTQITDASGVATFSDLVQIKPGGYLFAAVGSVGGRPAIVGVVGRSNRFNVSP